MLQTWALANPVAFEIIVGLYFQRSPRHPMTVGQGYSRFLHSNEWMKDPRRIDILSTNPFDRRIEQWIEPIDARFRAVAHDIGQATGVLEAAIRWWAQMDDSRGSHNVARVLRKAGWIQYMNLHGSAHWNIVHGILIMDEGKEKDDLMAQAEAESPSLFDFCLRDLFCGS